MEQRNVTYMQELISSDTTSEAFFKLYREDAGFRVHLDELIRLLYAPSGSMSNMMPIYRGLPKVVPYVTLLVTDIMLVGAPDSLGFMQALRQKKYDFSQAVDIAKVPPVQFEMSMSGCSILFAINRSDPEDYTLGKRFFLRVCGSKGATAFFFVSFSRKKEEPAVTSQSMNFRESQKDQIIEAPEGVKVIKLITKEISSGSHWRVEVIYPAIPLPERIYPMDKSDVVHAPVHSDKLVSPFLSAPQGKN